MIWCPSWSSTWVTRSSPGLTIKPCTPPDLTIDGVDRVPGPHLLLTHWNNVFEDRRLPQRCGGHALAPGCLGVFRTRDQVAFHGVVELVEIRVQRSLICPSVDSTRCT